MTHPDDNRPPPKENPSGHQHHDNRGDARTVPAEASGTGGAAGAGTQGAEGRGPQDATRKASKRKLPAPVLAL
jgi:hypothetical protein